MRNFVFIVCSLFLLSASQVFGQTATTTLRQAVQPIPMPASVATQQAVRQTAQPAIQGHTTYRPITTASPTAADAAVYQTSQPLYYQSQPAYQPARRAVYYQPQPQRVIYNSNAYGNIPITQRPSRPGHPYGNFVRFINRIGR